MYVLDKKHTLNIKLKVKIKWKMKKDYNVKILIIKNLLLLCFITKVDFETKSITNIERHFIMIKGLCDKGNTILNVTELKKSIDRARITVEEFSTYLSAVDRTTRKKFNKNVEDIT